MRESIANMLGGRFGESVTSDILSGRATIKERQIQIEDLRALRKAAGEARENVRAEIAAIRRVQGARASCGSVRGYYLTLEAARFVSSCREAWWVYRSVQEEYARAERAFFRQLASPFVEVEAS